MTDPFDTIARQAADRLRSRVGETVDTEAVLLAVAEAPRHRRPTGRFMAVAASLVLVIGAVTMVSNQAGDGAGDRAPVTVDTDRDLVAAPLALAGPRDGRDSIGLPVTVEPDTGLVDGQTVAVSGSGFVPGESVGIVMCSRAAGRVDLGGAGAGADACDILRFEQVTADDGGVASGTFVVHQALTTPYTGTIDCAASPEACIVAMGALADYDRSGGSPIAFADGLAPLDLPTLEATPTDGLADGDVVRLTGAEWEPGAEVFASICSADPSACWDLGSGQPVRVGDDGTLDLEVQVWRFLPGEPGTYVDCAVSSCLIRTTSYGQSAERSCGPGCVETDSSQAVSAPPVVVSFAPGGEPPASAALEVTPDRELATGDTIRVLGDGFAPGSDLWVHLCATRVAAAEQADELAYPVTCHSLHQGSTDGRGAWDWLPWVGGHDSGALRVDDDGRFGIEVELPDLGTAGECLDDECRTIEEWRVDCASDEWDCDVRTEGFWYGGHGRPTFAPAPVPLVYRGS